MTMTPDEIRNEANRIVMEIYELEPDELRGDADFHNVFGGDSIQKLELILTLERRFGVRYTLSDQASINCINDIVEVTGKYAHP